MIYTKKSPFFSASLLPHGNGKLLDYDDAETGVSFRYAQFNTRAVLDCPFRSAGCAAVCYATKGNHVFPSVKASRSRSFEESRREDFAQRITYSIRYHMETKRYKNAVMIIRIHESGDFYSVQYLRKWVAIWKEFYKAENIRFVFYTKSFRFFLMLSDEETELIREMMRDGTVSINLSMDDTTTAEQRKAYLAMLKKFPLCNTYYCTEDVEKVPHNNICDCANCAKCGACNKAEGKKTVVKIHSASNADMEVYRKNAGQA